jgi:2-phospho-L-lactate guanylyltransferase
LIIPVKSLAGGKSRLAPALTPARRRELNSWLLRRMLAAATLYPGRERTLLVSRCAAALALGRSAGVHCLPERRPHGLNRAASQALRSVRARGAGAVMLAACDLPRLRALDLRQLARRGARMSRGLLLCPDEQRRGTNALYLSPGVSLRFCFGRDSLRRHQAEARRRSLPVQLHRNRRLASDIDTVTQLRRWRDGRCRQVAAR